MIRRWGPWLILLALPFVANLPHLALGMSANPIYFASGLSGFGPDALFWGQPGWADPNAGSTTQALGGLAARQWLEGRVPWWNPYSGIGLPLAAEMQNSALFLPFVLLLRAFDGVIYLRIAMQIVAGTASFALLRQLRVGRRSALLGGVLYELNGSFAWLTGVAIMPVPFLPLLLLGIERARMHAAEGRRGGWAWISVALAYSLYAGFPETAYIDGLLALAWAVLRLAQSGWRARFAGKVAGAGVLGLLLAAPVLLPFIELLPVSNIGFHATGTAGIASTDFVTFLLPYFYGPIDYGFQWQLPFWRSIGGYVGMSPVLLGVLALLWRGRETGLRFLLAAWIAVALARSIDAPGVTGIVDLIPFVRQTIFGRYAPPSWEMAAVLLAAFALDDWHRGVVPGRRRVALALGLCGAALTAAVAVALAGARPEMRALAAAQPAYPVFPVASLAWATALTAAIAMVLAGRCSPWRRAVLGGLVAMDALGLFAFPMLAGVRHASYDREAVGFLRAHLGLSRFYTLGPFGPNYGAFFAVASINHNYLPVPQSWVDHVRAHLDPAVDGVDFTGAWPLANMTPESRADALWRRLPAYAALGVRYVVTPLNLDPFGVTIPPTDLQPVVARALGAGESVAGIVPGGRVVAGGLGRVSVTIGTYGGQSDGMLTAELCAGDACARGSVPLAGAADNAPIEIALASPLPVRAGDRLRYRITHDAGNIPIAIWMWPQPGGEGNAPALVLSYATPEPPRRVYRDAIMDIYELANPAPYFEAPGCALAPAGREAVRADCAAPARLLRRELTFPDWRAWVNGAETPITAADGIFQGVELPQGKSEIRFDYTPPHIRRAWAAFVLGLVGWLARLARGRA